MQAKVIDEINVGSKTEYSEDAIGYDEKTGHFWVIDGATHVGENNIPTCFQCNTDAEWYAKALSQRIHEVIVTTTERFDNILVFKHHVFPYLAQLFKTITNVSHFKLKGRDIPSAAGIIMFYDDENDALHLWSLADCRYIIQQGDTLIHNLEDEGKTAEIAFGKAVKSAVNPLEKSRMARDKRNPAGNSRNFSLDDGCLTHIKHEVIDLKGKPANILLMSDGMARLSEIYNTHSVQDMIKQTKETGLSSLASDLREYETKHADKIPMSKPKDDAAALFIEIC